MGSQCRCSSKGRRCRCARHSRHCADSETSTSDSDVEASPFVGRYSGTAACLSTESVRQVDTVCGTHTYTVVGYTLSRAMGAGTRLCSDLFEVGGQLFRLEVYPAGLNPDTHKYVSLFLTTPGSTRPGHLLYEISIVDRSQSKPQHITESRSAFIPSASEPAAVTAPCPGVVAGFPKFIKANFLHRNPRRFLPDDTLIVRATVKVLTGRSSFPVASACPPQVLSVYPNPAAAAAATAPALQPHLFPAPPSTFPFNTPAPGLSGAAPASGLYSPAGGVASLFQSPQLATSLLHPGLVPVPPGGPGLYGAGGHYGALPYAAARPAAPPTFFGTGAGAWMVPGNGALRA